MGEKINRQRHKDRKQIEKDKYSDLGKKEKKRQIERKQHRVTVEKMDGETQIERDRERHSQ